MCSMIAVADLRSVVRGERAREVSGVRSGRGRAGRTEVEELGLRAPGHDPQLEQVLVRAVRARADAELVPLRRAVREREREREEAAVLRVVPQEVRDAVCLHTPVRSVSRVDGTERACSPPGGTPAGRSGARGSGTPSGSSPFRRASLVRLAVRPQRHHYPSRINAEDRERGAVLTHVLVFTL